MKINAMRVMVRTLMACSIIAMIYVFLRLPQWVTIFTPKRSINVLLWPNIIDEKYCIEFEKKTGIKVYLTYFESYESLLVKLRTSGGGDYDLIMAVDYVVGALRREGLVKKFDHSKLRFMNELYPELLGLYFDPLNEYTLPFSWEAYGIGIDKSYFGGKIPPATWALLFDKNYAPERVGMLDYARDVVSIAALYLYGNKQLPRRSFSNLLTTEQLEKVKQLLIEQKQWVLMYTDQRSDYMLASKAAPVVLAISSEIYQAMRYNQDIEFLLPKEGSFMVVDNFLLPATSKKENLVYEFLNHLYERERVQKYVEKYNFFPALKGLDFGDKRFALVPDQSLLSKLRFFTYHIPEQQLRKLWIAVKS